MIVIKEEFVGGEKWRRAVKLGRSDAIVMWLALKCYASQHPTSEGFVPDEDIEDLPGAPTRARQALQALVECGRLLPEGGRGPGLVDPADGGWRLHDYLDHSATPEELELRREKARVKKQRQREAMRRELELFRQQARGLSRGDSVGDTPGDIEGDTPRVPLDVPAPVPVTSLAGAHTPAPGPARTGARPQPNPTQPNPTQGESSEPRALPERTVPPPDETTPAVYTRIPKPFKATAALLGAAATAGVTPEELDECIAYWKARIIPPTHDLDQFFMSKLAGIRTHAETARARARTLGPSSAPTPQDDVRAYAAIQPQGDHIRFAEEHGLDLRAVVDKLQKDPKVKKLSTPQQWDLLTKLLERAAGASQQRLGGAA